MKISLILIAFGVLVFSAAIAVAGVVLYRHGYEAGVMDAHQEASKFSGGIVTFDDSNKTATLDLGKMGCMATKNVNGAWEVSAKPDCKDKGSVITLRQY